ncbi:hypothetical protein Tco_0967889 [Tanacetum coccineum]
MSDVSISSYVIDGRHVNEPEEDVPSVVTPNHLEVQNAECSNLSFGGFDEVENQHAEVYGLLKLGREARGFEDFERQAVNIDLTT